MIGGLNLNDAESSFLKGRAEFEQWKREFEFAWNMPTVVAYLGQYVKAMPDYVRQELPTEAAILDKLYESLAGG